MPSLNPDGQIMVTDWYNKNLGTEFEASPMPWLYHPYIGHDNNRDMYMFTQKESQLTAQLLWHDWFPSVWLDEHQMNQVFARYAKDLLERQTYPEVRRSPNSLPEPPYNVTAWSLGMQMGVETVFVKKPLA